MTTGLQQTELEKPVTRTVYFGEFHFLSGTQFLSSWNVNYTWNSQLWLGFGTICGISSVDESESLDARSLTFTLNVAQVSILPLALGNVSEYRGRDARLYYCPLDENYRLVDTPELCWRGYMDTMTVGVEGDPEGGEPEGKIALLCETSARGLRRKSSLRLNAAQQKKRHPSDTGLDYLTDLIAHPQLWLTKRFQER